MSSKKRIAATHSPVHGRRLRLPFLLVLPALLLALPVAALTAPVKDSDEQQLQLALAKGAVPATQLNLAVLAPKPGVTTSSPALQGELVITPDPSQSRMVVLRDRFGYAQQDNPNNRGNAAHERAMQARQTLPVMRIALIENHGELLPRQRGIVVTDNPAWDYLIEPGAIWRAPESPDWRQASLPFALIERNANCVHNGILRFALDQHNQPSSIYFQISSETCAYFQFSLRGSASATWQSQPFAEADTVIADRKREREHRLPTDSLAELARRYPRIDALAFSADRDIHGDNRTLAGVVIDGVHYRTGCDTRDGQYPFCEALALPSYSTAKSVVAGLALMRLQKLHPGIAAAQLRDYVPECRTFEQWQQVTFEHALDMATGNYDSAVADADESAAHLGQFVGAERHEDKIRYACQQFTRKATPGTRMVYHSSDTYLLGSALQAWLSQHEGADRDLYRDVLYEPIFKPLQLSPVMAVTRRTYDTRQQPFTSFGLIYLPDDVAKLLHFLGPADGRLETPSPPNSRSELPFDQTLFSEAMQQRRGQQSLSAGMTGVRYENGFWAVNIADMLGCRQPLYVPTLSGYGGISWVLFPNGIGYYYFSDGDEFRWQQATRAAHQIRSMCK